MKVLTITLLHTARLEHSPNKIYLKASIEEEESAVMVSARMYGIPLTYKKQVKLTHSINHQELVS